VNRTKIEWCDFTWNPVVGCSGTCPYCYARKMAHRFHFDFYPHWVEGNFDRTMPRKPSRIFVNSMSDLADWKAAWCEYVFDRIREYPQHLFLFLSKRPWDCHSWWPMPNAMLGYSVTRQDDLDLLAKHGNKEVSFLSIEPLLGPVSLSLAWRPRWIIVGAETGNRKGKIVPELPWLWAIEIYARGKGIPLFFKESLREQLGEYEFPQEFPR
jgi:protein gp37